MDVYYIYCSSLHYVQLPVQPSFVVLVHNRGRVCLELSHEQLQGCHGASNHLLTCQLLEGATVHKVVLNDEVVNATRW